MLQKDWIESGLFDESITAYGLIGQTFNKQLIRLGYQYQFNPRARIIHRTEFKQNFLYKRVRPSAVSTALRGFLKKVFPSLFSVVKRIKLWIQYR